MSWFPQFLNPLAALVALAIAVPALLVLYFLKLRRHEMAVSSTLLWRKAIQDLQVNAPFQKLRRNLLLLLQLLLLALLCLALSRPVSNYTPKAGKLTVIIVDRSASMQAMDDFGGEKRVRLDEAKRQARALVDSMMRGDSAMVMAADDGAEIVCPFTTDAGQLRTAIDSIRATDRRTEFRLAYQLAQAQTAFIPEQLRGNDAEKPQVFVYSDGRVADAKELSINGDLHYTRIGSDTAANVGLVALSAKRNYERPTEVQVFGRLSNFGPDPVKADVQLFVDGVVRGTATDLALVPERWNDPGFPEDKKDKKLIEAQKNSFDFPKIDLAAAAVIRVEQMTKDALACDDAAVVVVPPPKALSVLLVTDGNYFLEKAIHALNLQNPEVLSPIAYEEQKPTKHDVILFDKYQPKFMPPAGNYMWFGVVPAGLKLKEVKAKVDGKPTDDPEIVEDVMVLDWKRDHPLLKGINLTKLYVGRTIRMDVPPESEPLVEGYKGPIVVLHREGRSTHLVCGFDLMESNWPLKISFPIFMHNAMQFLALGSEMDVRESFPPGATPKVPRPNIQKVDPDGKLKEFKLKDPAGRVVTVTIPESGDVVLPALDKVGIWTTEPAIPGYERVAVNLLDANESNLLPADQPPGGIGSAVNIAAGKSRLELWWWIVLCCAVPLLMIEWWVYTRRVHL